MKKIDNPYKYLIEKLLKNELEVNTLKENLALLGVINLEDLGDKSEELFLENIIKEFDNSIIEKDKDEEILLGDGTEEEKTPKEKYKENIIKLKEAECNILTNNHQNLLSNLNYRTIFNERLGNDDFSKLSVFDKVRILNESYRRYRS